MIFPKIKNVSSQLLNDQISSVKPLTIEDAAQGREIKKYPYKYDTFDSIEDLKNYIEDRLVSNKKLNVHWIKVDKIIHLPFNLRDDVYFTNTELITITCNEPRESFHQDIVRGEIFCNLKPSEWKISDIKDIIKQLQNEA